MYNWPFFLPKYNNKRRKIFLLFEFYEQVSDKNSRCTVGSDLQAPISTFNKKNAAVVHLCLYLNNSCLFHKLVNNNASSNVSADYKMSPGFHCSVQIGFPCSFTGFLDLQYSTKFLPKRQSYCRYTNLHNKCITYTAC